MHCPRCGQQQISDQTKFCSRCGFQLGLVSELLMNGGFLPQLADTTASQISIEAAQPRLDLGVLKDLSGKSIMLGVIDLGTEKAESAEIVAERIRAGLKQVPAERLIVAPDCGMKYLPREVAFGKMCAMVEGAAIVRRELEG